MGKRYNIVAEHYHYFASSFNTPPLDIKGAKYFNYYQWTELTVHCCHKT